MVTTLCVSGGVVLKAGTNSKLLTEAQFEELINQAEGFISAQARYDYVTNYASISDIGKQLLEDTCTSKAAMFVINNDMSGFSSRTEAQVMLDVNNSQVVDNINLLRDADFKQFVQNGDIEG